MAHLYLVPNWFFGISIFLELLFAVVTIAVAYYSYKIYKLSGQRETKIFSLAFLFIAVSYILWACINFFIAAQLNQNLRALDFQEIGRIIGLNQFAIYAFFVFFIIGLITLTYTTLKINNRRTYILIILTSLLGLFLSCNVSLTFYLLSSVLLFLISGYYYEEYQLRKNKKTLITLVAFTCLFFGNLNFIFTANNYVYYVIGHILKLAAYGLILFNLVSIFKKQK